MQSLEHSIRPLTHQRDLGHVKRPWQLWKTFTDRRLRKETPRAGQLAGERHVKPKLVHHVGVSPTHEVCLLAGCQSGRAAARDLGRRGRRTQPVELRNHVVRQALKRRRITYRCQGQKSTDHGQFKARQPNRWVALGDPVSRGLKRLPRGTLGQSKWRHQRAMKPILPGCQGDVFNPGDIRSIANVPKFDVPAQPLGPEFGNRTFRRQIVDAKT